MPHRPASAPLVAAAALGFAAALVACGGARGRGPSPPPTPPPARGTLVGTPLRTASYSTSDLASRVPIDPLGRAVLALVAPPTCGVDVWRLEYRTVGGRDESTIGTAALMVPTGTAAGCGGPRPVVVYAHGTSTAKGLDLARPDGADAGEALALAALFAGQGAIVVAPNYAGYSTSTLGYHPYLDADQQSKDVVDALAATRAALAGTGANAGPKLFVTGYSQGGFVALATARALDAAGTPPTAVAPLSGPYALAAFGDAIFAGRVSMSAVVNLVLLATSYQRAYGDLYASPTEFYNARYAAGAEALLPSSSGVATLVTQGQLPADALFPSAPPAPQYAAITPATTPSALAPVFARGFGPDALVTNAYRLAYLRDADAQPDGGFPMPTSGLPAAAPGHPLRRALKRNDLRGYVPRAPTLLCGGAGDPTVFWSNTELYAATLPAGAPVTVLDVDAASPAGDRWRDYRTAFALAKAATFAAGGSNAVLAAYHAALVAPACLAAAKAFFDTH